MRINTFEQYDEAIDQYHSAQKFAKDACAIGAQLAGYNVDDVDLPSSTFTFDDDTVSFLLCVHTFAGSNSAFTEGVTFSRNLVELGLEGNIEMAKFLMKKGTND